MKAIVQNGTNISLYNISDETEVLIKSDITVVGNPVEFYISDCNSNNCTLVEGLKDPGDWAVNKYLVVNGEFKNNPLYAAPEEVIVKK